MRKLVIGLTGGVGCGKSTMAKRLTQLGASVIDVDQAGRWAVEQNPEVREQIRAAFGDGVFISPSELDRRKLGALIFADPVLREKLNHIVHPVMIERVRNQIREAQQNSGAPYIAVDAALIFELGLDKELDLTVVVRTPLEQCLQWVKKRDRLSEKAIRQRMAAQLPVEEKILRADYIIDNDGSMEKLQKKVRQLHEWLIRQGRKISSGAKTPGHGRKSLKAKTS